MDGVRAMLEHQSFRKPLPMISVEFVMMMNACGSVSRMNLRSANACERVSAVSREILSSFVNAPVTCEIVALRLSSLTMKSMIEQAEQTLDAAARTELLSQICTKINEKALMVSLYTTTYVRAYNADLQGMHCSASGYTMYQDLYWAE